MGSLLDFVPPSPLRPPPWPASSGLNIPAPSITSRLGGTSNNQSFMTRSTYSTS
jgi:hypothetical protein